MMKRRLLRTRGSLPVDCSFASDPRARSISPGSKNLWRERARAKIKLKRRHPYWAYLVECRDGSYYAGSTRDLKARIKLHNEGHGAKYLRGRRPVKLVYAREFRYFKNVLRAERNLKKLKRKQKEVLTKAYAQDHE